MIIFVTIEFSVPWCVSDKASSITEWVKHDEMMPSACAADLRASWSKDSRKPQTFFHARGSSDKNSLGNVSLQDTRAFATTNVHAGDTVVSLSGGQAEWIADIMSGSWATSVVSSLSERRAESVEKAELER